MALEPLVQEAEQQFFQGYNFFREHAGQLWLPPPAKVAIEAGNELSKNHRVSSLDTYGIRSGVNGHTEVSVSFCPHHQVTNITSSVNLIWYGNIDEIVRGGYFLHEGSEMAYVVTRACKRLPFSRKAGEFAGNVGLTAHTKKLSPVLTIPISGAVLEITTTASHNSALDKLAADAMNDYTGTGALDRLGAFFLEKTVKLKMRQIHRSSAPYFQANDLIDAFRSGEKDSTLIDPFLKFLAVGRYSTRLPIQQLFRQFSREYSPQQR